MWDELIFLGNELTIVWNDLTIDCNDLTIDCNDLTWNDLTMERNDRIPRLVFNSQSPKDSQKSGRYVLNFLSSNVDSRLYLYRKDNIGCFEKIVMQYQFNSLSFAMILVSLSAELSDNQIYI